MSNPENSKEKFVKFISGKGFYAVLAVCLVGAGTAAWVAVDRTIDSIDENNKSISQKQSSTAQPNWDFPDAEETRKNQSQVEVESSKSPASSSEASSQKPSTKKEEKKTPSSSTEQNNTSAKLTYILPIEGEIFNQYSDGKLVKDITLNEWRTHNGIDIKAPLGSPVLAVASGKITKLHTDKVWGAVIEITHANGVVSVYCGVVADKSLREGDDVTMKQALGKTDKIPGESALEPHLHFAMKKDENWINPLKEMNKLK